MAEFWNEYGVIILEGLRDTTIMVVVSTIFAYIIGLPLGVLLIVTRPGGIWEHPWLNRVVGWIVNIGRSIPFMILMILLLGFTKFLVGTQVGVLGAIPPLVISAAPFVARMVETSLSEVDAGVVEAAQSMGASPLQIVWKVLLPESVPSLIRGAAVTVITLVGYSAMAGALGGGGLGDIAVRYGMYRYEYDVMLLTLVLIVILVQLIQMVFDLIAKRVDKRAK